MVSCCNEQSYYNCNYLPLKLWEKSKITNMTKVNIKFEKYNFKTLQFPHTNNSIDTNDFSTSARVLLLVENEICFETLLKIMALRVIIFNGKEDFTSTGSKCCCLSS